MFSINPMLRTVVTGMLAWASTANAASLVETFNDFPSEERILATNYGAGWPAGFGTTAQIKWGEDPNDGTTGGTSSIRTTGTVGDLVAPVATGYNLTQPVITAARSVSGTSTSAVRQNRYTGGMAGDIWMSWLMAPSADGRLGINVNGAVKGFNGADNVRFIAVGSSFNVYTGTNTFTAPGTFTSGSTALVLGLLQLDAAGTDDRVRLWVNPNVGLGEANVITNQAPLHDLILNNTDIGSSLNTVGVVAYSASRNPGQLDNIRFSNEASGFFDVTGVIVPEPRSLASLTAACLAAIGYHLSRGRGGLLRPTSGSPRS